MKKFFKPIFEDSIIKWGFFLSTFFIFLAGIFIVIFFSQLPPFLPLYNKLPWGYSRLGGKFEIFIPIAITCIFFVSNLIISSVLYKKIPLLARLLCATTLIICLSLCIYIIEIVFLVK